MLSRSSFLFQTKVGNLHINGLRHNYMTSKTVCLGWKPGWDKTKKNVKLANSANKHTHSSYKYPLWYRNIKYPYSLYSTPPHPVLTQQFGKQNSTGSLIMDFISFSTCWKTQRNMLQQKLCNRHSFEYFMLQLPTRSQIFFFILPIRAQCSKRNHYASFEPNQKQRPGKPALGTDILD